MTKRNTYPPVLPFGLLTGLGVVLLYTVLYVFDPKLFISLWWLKLLIIIPMSLVALFVLKNKVQDYLDFKVFLKYSFGTAVIAFFMWFAMKYVLFNFIDTDMMRLKNQAEIEFIDNYASGISEEQRETAIDNINLNETLTFRNVSMEFAIACILSFGYSAIFSTIFFLAFKHRKDTMPLPDENPISS